MAIDARQPALELTRLKGRALIYLTVLADPVNACGVVRLRLSGGLAATNRLFAVTLDFGAVSRTGANATLFTAIGTAYGAGDGFAAGGTAFHASLASTAGCNNTTCSTAFTGGGGAHNNIQPFIVANYITNQ